VGHFTLYWRKISQRFSLFVFKSKKKQPIIHLFSNGAISLPKNTFVSIYAVVVAQLVICALSQRILGAEASSHPAFVEPANGFQFDRNVLNGRGQLRLSNATGHNAVLKLRGPSEEETFSWFLRPGSHNIVGIPDQDYTVQFCIGDGWVENKRGINGAWFASDHGCSQVKYPARFEISEEADGVYETAQFLTLRDIVRETVTNLPITRQLFLSK